MIRLFTICALVLLMTACQKEDHPTPVDPETTDPQWTKLSIPKQQRGISAIYGDIDDTLVVATAYAIYLTTDKGASWEKVKDSQTGLSGFSMYEGELMALNNFNDIASTPILHSTDHGKTWDNQGNFDYTIYDAVRINRKEAHISEYEYFNIRRQPDAITDPEYGRPLNQPDLLTRTVDGAENPIYFPFRRILNYVYLDKKKRLYVGAEGAQFEWGTKGNTRTYPTYTDSAILYISKTPVDTW